MSIKPGQMVTSAKDALNAGTPNQTLYIKNLQEKTNKNELRRALYMIFSTYGPVLDIVTNRVGRKGQQMRGQAHVVFRDIQTSTQAMRALQGFDLLGKEMVIVYAKGQSQVIPRLRGAFEPSTASSSAPGPDTTQRSIFNAPPPAVPSKQTENGVKPTEPAAGSENAPHGTKRAREEEDDDDDDDEEVEMEEDEDDAPMEEDDDD